jgi:hypothetical protein
MTIISRLLQAGDPAVRYKVLVDVLGFDPNSTHVAAVREEIRASERVRRQLAKVIRIDAWWLEAATDATDVIASSVSGNLVRANPWDP